MVPGGTQSAFSVGRTSHLIILKSRSRNVTLVGTRVFRGRGGGRLIVVMGFVRGWRRPVSVGLGVDVVMIRWLFGCCCLRMGVYRGHLVFMVTVWLVEVL